MKIPGKKRLILLILPIMAAATVYAGPPPGEKAEVFDTIVPGVYRFRDACNVYLLKSGHSALLIDAGAGMIGTHLKDAGITRIEWILHTHYHRDQCTGDNKIRDTSTRIAIGAPEADYLRDDGIRAPFPMPDKYLLNGELPGWGARLAPFDKPGVDKTFTDGEEFSWNGFKITAISTPGHTQGSFSYIVKTQGKTLCFTGDLIMKGGHVRDLFSMQWIYLSNPGVEASLSSLEKIRAIAPDILLPSHGDIMRNPAFNIDQLEVRLARVRDAFGFERAGRWNWSGFVQISAHVIQDCGSTTQIIFNDEGNALLFDCGDAFTPERLEKVRKMYGIRHVDVIIPSHWHYDHVDGIPAIVKSEGAKVWAFEPLAEHLEYPEHFPTTCWSGQKIRR